MFYLTTSSSFCQALFSTFSKFFQRLSQLFAALSDSSFILPELSEFVKHFFSLRSKFFRSRRWLDRRVSDSLLTIPDPFSFVKYFFQKFPLAIFYIFDRENALSYSSFTAYLGFPLNTKANEHQSRASPLKAHVIRCIYSQLSCAAYNFHSSKFTSILQAPFPRYSGFMNRSPR